MITPQSLRVLRSLLFWDRARIAGFHQIGSRRDCSDYIARMDRAESALVDPRASWSREVREYWQVLLEVSGEISAGVSAEREVVGIFETQRVPKQPDEARGLETVRAVAAEIGVLSVLQRAGSGVWRRP